MCLMLMFHLYLSYLLLASAVDSSPIVSSSDPVAPAEPGSILQTIRVQVVISTAHCKATPQVVGQSVKDLALLGLLKKGMSEKQVSAILGKPVATDSLSEFHVKRWGYPAG